jgi:hypothetical protein
MRTDGMFTLQEFVVSNWKYDKPLSLIPFGDIHRDSPAHSDHKWKEFCEYGKRNKDAIFLGMGDYLDSYSTSERMILNNPAIHDSTRKREEVEAKSRIDMLAKELSFARNRTIGLLCGNHFIQFADGTTSDMHLAAKLNGAYLGVCSAIRVVFQNMHGSSSVSIDIFAHHGKGAGQTVGGKLNAVEKLASIAEADIFLMGDNHARGCVPMGDKLRIVGSGGALSLRSRQSWIGRTGSFLKSYEPNQVSYVVDAALAPANLGWIEFKLTPRRIREGGVDRSTVDIGSIQ